MLINGEVHSWRGIGRIVGLLTVLFAALALANWVVADAELGHTWHASTVAASGDAALAAAADTRGGGGSSGMGVPSTLGQC